jgi:N-acetylglucosaminyltransferase
VLHALYQVVVTHPHGPHWLPEWSLRSYWWVRTHWHKLIPLGIVGLLSWGIWLVRFFLSHTANPIDNDFRTTTSVIVPSYREDPEILLRCLDSWLAEDPGEVIIVLDVHDQEAYERLQEVPDPRVLVILFEHKGKRSALGVGIKAARFEVIVLTDSDTSWEPGLLAAVEMPFFDSRVGAVGTRRSAYAPESSVWRRVANWIINIRYLDYVPAMGRAGAVICVSGRTAAYRRSAVMPVLSNLEYEFFLGKRCVAGDDGRLTWLILASGYKTVHQGHARAISMFPDTFRAFTKQRVRWSRNSYRTYLTALWKGWLFQQPLISQITAFQILLTPVTMGLALFFLVRTTSGAFGAGLWVIPVWIMFARAVRGVSHLREHPKDIVILPLVAAMVIFVSLPVKLYAFFTMNKQGWLTRNANQIGGDGQTEIASAAGGSSVG